MRYHKRGKYQDNVIGSTLRSVATMFNSAKVAHNLWVLTISSSSGESRVWCSKEVLPAIPTSGSDEASRSLVLCTAVGREVVDEFKVFRIERKMRTFGPYRSWIADLGR